jgi:hypothetical protein
MTVGASLSQPRGFIDPHPGDGAVRTRGGEQTILLECGSLLPQKCAQASILALPGSALQKAKMLDCGLFRRARDSVK